MTETADAVERRIPDHVSTAALPPPLAAEIDFLAGRDTPGAESGGLDVGVHARALVAAGRCADGRSLLAALDPDALSVQGRAAATWAVSRVGPRTVIDAFGPWWRDGPDFVMDGDIPLGPRESYVGMLVASTGDLADAARVLRRAASVGDRRTPLWGALARAELSRVLRCAVAVGDGAPVAVSDDELQRVSVAARTFFAAGGYRGLLQRFDDDVGIDRTPGAAATARLCSGDDWSGGFGVQPATALRGGKGLIALEYLLRGREREITAVELGRVVDGDDPAPIAQRLAGVNVRELLDPRAAALSSEAVERLRVLVLDEVERSRISKLLRRTINGLAGDQPLLAAHLGGAVRTGYVCSYEPSHPVEWRFSELRGGAIVER